MDKNLFRQFIDEMNVTLQQGQNDSNETLLNQLLALEHRFKVALMSVPQGRAMYRKFMDYIMNDCGNMLSARSYFRERQDVCTQKIFKAFHKNNPKMLHAFRINYEFVRWVTETYKGPKKKILISLEGDIVKVRAELCQNNLPLAINRAKMVWVKTYANHIDYMDLIQGSSEGLLTAIDKFVPPYRRVFLSTAIGRMNLNMTTECSSTLVQIPESEKRILYRASNAKNKENISDPQKVVEYIQQSFKGVTQDKLQEIEAAAYDTVHMDQTAASDGNAFIDPSKSAEENLEAKERSRGLYTGLKSLEVMETKVIKLKTGDI